MRGRDFEAFLLFRKDVNYVPQTLPAVVASQVYDYTLQDYVKPINLYEEQADRTRRGVF